MKQMDIQWVRYPGGEKSDWHFFSTPPYEKAEPTVLVLTYNKGWGGYYQSVNDQDVLDFDEYILYLREFGGSAYVVVPYESYERSNKSKEEFVEHAVAWVRYANIRKDYGVMYWEVGNENWHNKTGSASEIAHVGKEFSQAMKSVDPNIKVGCSGITHEWCKTLLKIAGEDLDFIAVSNYWGRQKSFEYYRVTENVILDEWARNAAQAIKESPHSDRIRVIVSEFGSITWSPKTWPDLNNLGHAIVSFDIAGQLLCNNSVEFAMLWGTRYMHGAIEKNWYALGNRNEILPAGRPLAIWGRFLKSKMVKVSGPKRSRCFASYEPRANALTVFVINKDTASRKVRIEVKATCSFSTVDVYNFAGTGEADMKPTWSKVGSMDISDNILDGIELPGTSITVLDMRAND
jgi:alpha-L-arabinofuranosidase